MITYKTGAGPHSMKYIAMVNEMYRLQERRVKNRMAVKPAKSIMNTVSRIVGNYKKPTIIQKLIKFIGVKK